MDLSDHRLAMQFVDGNEDAGYIALANMGEAHKGLRSIAAYVLEQVAEWADQSAGDAYEDDMGAIASYVELMAGQLRNHALEVRDGKAD